jgi:hypothetical protein
MYELKKIGKVFTSKSVETGPSSYKKRIYRVAVSQRLRSTSLESWPICLKWVSLFYEIKISFLFRRQNFICLYWLMLVAWLARINFLCGILTNPEVPLHSNDKTCVDWEQNLGLHTPTICCFISLSWSSARIVNLLGLDSPKKFPTTTEILWNWHDVSTGCMTNPSFCDSLSGSYSLPSFQFVDEWLKILPSRLKACYIRVQKLRLKVAGIS